MWENLVEVVDDSDALKFIPRRCIFITRNNFFKVLQTIPNCKYEVVRVPDYFEPWGEEKFVRTILLPTDNGLDSAGELDLIIDNGDGTYTVDRDPVNLFYMTDVIDTEEDI